MYKRQTVLSVSDTGVGADVKVRTPSGERTISAEKVLLSVGRGPNTASLGLDKTGVKLENGYIVTDERMETSVSGIYAIGDCNGKLMLAHAATVSYTHLNAVASVFPVGTVEVVAVPGLSLIHI